MGLVNQMKANYLKNAQPKSVAIIGGGPAGCAVALSLHNALSLSDGAEDQVSINVFDAGKKQSAAIGETIPPAATPLLYQLEIQHLINNSKHHECPGSMSLWGSDKAGYNDFLYTPIGKGYHLDRAEFNRQILDVVVAKNITYYPDSSLSQLEAKEDKFQLKFNKKNKQAFNFDADYVVDASGKSAVFARRLSVARNLLDEVISLCVIVETPAGFTKTTLVEAVEDGWWYAASLPNKTMIISFCSDISRIKEANYLQQSVWIEAFCKTQLLSQHIPKNILTDTMTIHKRVAPSSILSQVTGKNWVAIGDAASSYDSVSSAGITKALQNGLSAGKALSQLILENSSSAMQDYQNSVFHDFNQYAKLRYDIYKSETRFQSQPFWQRRFQ